MFPMDCRRRCQRKHQLSRRHPLREEREPGGFLFASEANEPAAAAAEPTKQAMVRPGRRRTRRRATTNTKPTTNPAWPPSTPIFARCCQSRLRKNSRCLGTVERNRRPHPTRNPVATTAAPPRIRPGASPTAPTTSISRHPRSFGRVRFAPRSTGRGATTFRPARLRPSFGRFWERNWIASQGRERRTRDFDAIPLPSYNSITHNAAPHSTTALQKKRLSAATKAPVFVV
mmetsp:Transcript_6941/g.14096  ORF Transcript_6941/g.14096 Transcript_6941/m.14096 type:complete len:230 (-) Transcript_6941:336-1025(-)